MLEFQDGPTIVVGHSYGGQIITALGADAPNVVGLVYIAAFALDEGESLGALLSQGPVTPALEHLFTDSRGFGWLSEDDFVNHFAADVEPTQARVMYAVQQPLASSAFTDVMGVPAWKSLPSWYLVAQNDEAIPPDAERSSPRGWARPPSRSRRATWRWSPILPRSPTWSRRRPMSVGPRRPLTHAQGGTVSMTITEEQMRPETPTELRRRFDSTSHGRQRDRVRVPRPR